MAIEPLELVCLLAVRQLGGRDVAAKQDLFSKGLKLPLQAIQAKGWLRLEKAEVVTVGKTGKPKKSKIDVLTLTADGEAVLQQSAQPEALAATLAGQLEGDRQKLQDELRTAVQGGGQSSAGAAGKEIVGLAKTVKDLVGRLEKIERQLGGTNPETVLERIDQAFANLLAKLGQRGTAPSHVTPTQPTTVAAPPASLRAGLHQAYRDLCQLIEFEDRVVPLYRLYHQAKYLLPGLSVPDFHRELLQLWNQRVLELKVLNEVRQAAEPEKAIRQGDNLYYFVLWHQS